MKNKPKNGLETVSKQFHYCFIFVSPNLLKDLITVL